MNYSNMPPPDGNQPTLETFDKATADLEERIKNPPPLRFVERTLNDLPLDEVEMILAAEKFFRERKEP